MENNEKKSWVKGLKLGLNIVFYVIIVVLLLFSIANLQAKDYEKVPNLFGIGFLNVATDSMEPLDGIEKDDSLYVGDLAIVRTLNDKRRADLEVGDIVTFFDPNAPSLNGKITGGFNTHRIYKIVEINGKLHYQTKGDNQESPDLVYRTSDELLAVYKSKWSGFGKVIGFMQTPLGFGLFVILPIFLILVYQAVILVMNILRTNKQKLVTENELKQEELQQQLELEKERIRQQVLEELKNENKKK